MTTTPVKDLSIDRPISGDVQHNHRSQTPQLTPAEFLAEIDRALVVEGVTGLIWEQYTPFFNDGDPCEFSVHEVRVLVGEDDEEENNDLDYGRGWSSYDLYNYPGESPYRGNLDKVSWVELPGGVSGRTIYELLDTLNVSGWEQVALANFGDHAQVIARMDGFEVEYYEHD